MPEPTASRAAIDWQKLSHLDKNRLAELCDEVVVEARKKQLQGAFAALLSDTFRHYGFGPQRRSYHELAGQIAHWQEDERLIPYDPLLVQSWFEGENIPETAAWEAMVVHFREDERTDAAHAKKWDVLDAMFSALSANRFAKVREASQKVAEELGFKSVKDLARQLCDIINSPNYRVMREEEAHQDTISIHPHVTNLTGFLQGTQQTSMNYSRQIISALEILYLEQGISTEHGFLQLQKAVDASQQKKPQSKKGTHHPYTSEISRTASVRVKVLTTKKLKQADIAKALDLLSPSGNETPLLQRLNGQLLFTPEELIKLDALCLQHSIVACPPLIDLYFHRTYSKAARLWEQAVHSDAPFGGALTALRESVDWTQTRLGHVWALQELSADATEEARQRKIHQKRSSINQWEKQKKMSSGTTYKPSQNQLCLLIDLMLDEQQRLADAYGAAFTPFIDQAKIDYLEAQRTLIAPEKKEIRRHSDPPPDPRIGAREIPQPLMSRDHPAQNQRS